MYLEGQKLAIWLCFSSLYIWLNLYYFEYLYDVIYDAESALCNININKHHLQQIKNYKTLIIFSHILKQISLIVSFWIFVFIIGIMDVAEKSS